jgi:hypothetical protein
VTDASPSQTEPAEPDGGAEGAPKADNGDRARAAAPESPRWSERQPEPAPWFVGRPGGAPQQQAGWGVATPPQYPAPPQPQPYGQPQAPQPPQHQNPGSQVPSQGAPDDARDSGRPEADRPSGADEAKDADAGAEKPSTPDAQQPGAQPPQNPYGQPGPYGGPPPPVAPWHDPNRYGTPPRQQQDGPWQRQRQPRPPAQQEPRGPLDLRTRWSRGLALGAIVCTLASIWYSISDFPTWLVGAGAGLVLGLVGLWLGVFAQRAALAKGKRAPEAVSAIVWSSIASLLSLMIIAFSLIFYPQLSQLSTCVRSATTISAQNQCETNFKNEFGGTG